MHLDRRVERKSIHQLAFAHYLRTGQRLTSEEWLAAHRPERKFNPYRDERGRFTSPPGVVVSWGQQGNAGAPQAREPRWREAGSGAKPAPTRPAPDRGQTTPDEAAHSGNAAISSPDTSSGGFRSAFVRNHVAQAGNAETYFELNKRQAGLDRLREAAGPSPSPAVKADLDDIQRRLDADRGRLDEISRTVVAEQTREILRAGLAPVDIALGAANIASGEGELRDYLAVAGAIPIGGTLGKIGKGGGGVATPLADEIIQMGGSYSTVRKLRGYHAHHMPADSISPLSKGKGPSIAMRPEDHQATLSYGRGARQTAHRQAQADLIEKGDFRGAQQLEIDDLRSKFGSRYDPAIEEMLEYSRKRGF